MNRRNFLLALLGSPLIACAETITITILPQDKDRFKDSEALRDLLLADIEDMDIHKQLGLNLRRVKDEDKLYKKIQEDRRW